MLPGIIDIAELANTSKSTVSRYLNGGHIKPMTAQAIDKAIKKLNYHPNVNARRLVTSKTNVIGVVLDDISNVYYSDMLSGMQKVAADKNYVCTFYSRNSSNKSELDYLNLFYGGQIDGLILGTFQNRDPQQVQELAESGFPIVLTGDCAGVKNIICVDVDNKQGTIDAVDYLVSLGHKDIAYLKGPQNMSAASYRASGFVKGMQKNGLDPTFIENCEWSVSGGYSAAKCIMQAGRDFTAILCSNEYCAYGAITALKEAKIQVPGQVSVVAFDDGVLAQLTEPSITTIKQPFHSWGEMAIRLLLDCIDNNEVTKSSILLQPEIVKRLSCSPVK